MADVNGIPVLHTVGPYGIAVTASGSDILVGYQPMTGNSGGFNWIPTGSVLTQALTAALSFTSAQTRLVKDTLTAAALSFTSAQVRLPKVSITASWSGTGAVTTYRRIMQTVTGALSFTSNQTRKVTVTINAATLSFTGALTRRARVAYSAAGSFTGNLTIIAKVLLTAALSFSGSNSQSPITTPPPASSETGIGWFVRWRRRRNEY